MSSVAERKLPPEGKYPGTLIRVETLYSQNDRPVVSMRFSTEFGEFPSYFGLSEGAAPAEMSIRLAFQNACNIPLPENFPAVGPIKLVRLLRYGIGYPFTLRFKHVVNPDNPSITHVLVEVIP